MYCYLGDPSEIFGEEPKKAESAKLPGAGIAPTPCPRNARRKRKIAANQFVEGLEGRTERDKAAAAVHTSVPQRVMVECRTSKTGTGLSVAHFPHISPKVCPAV